MPKARRVFVCRACGSVASKWSGKCSDCGSWDSLEETIHDPSADADPQRGLAQASIALAIDDLREGSAFAEGLPSGGLGGSGGQAIPLRDVDAAAEPVRRLESGIVELDRVLGGGLVPGSAVLIGGEPGIGKSTLLLQAAVAWCARGQRVLYVSSEESVRQVGLRARRLSEGREGPPPGNPANGDDRLLILADTNLARIIEQTRRATPAVLMVDSVQMIYKSDLPAGPGSITQLRRCTSELVYLAKASGIAVVLVGHVTKDGVLAGPRLLEHLVDAVLTFEGDRYHAYRVVRAVKNRFGTTLEIGLFAMTASGLVEAAAGTGVSFPEEPRPGSVVCPTMTGSRCVLVELQALTATGFLGAAKRKSSGLDPNRLAMIIAVLEQHSGLRLADRDVFASAVGGIRVLEPGSDLALLLAVAGAHHRRSMPPRTAALGEVGLGGEIRPVPHLDQRLREAARLGATRVLIPAASAKDPAVKEVGRSLQISAVRTVDQAIEHLT